MLPFINILNFLEKELLQIAILLLLYLIIHPFFLYFKYRISKLKTYSVLLLERNKKKIIESISIDNLVFDSSQINSLGKSVLVEDLLNAELKLIGFSLNNYFSNLLGFNARSRFERFKTLYSIYDTRQIILDLVTEYENCLQVIKLSHRELIYSNLEVDSIQEIKYLKRYKDKIKSTDSIKLQIRNSKAETVLLKYEKIVIIYRQILIKHLVNKINSELSIDKLIIELLTDFTINYTSLLKTIHFPVNYWNGELAGLKYKGLDL